MRERGRAAPRALQVVRQVAEAASDAALRDRGVESPQAPVLFEVRTAHGHLRVCLQWPMCSPKRNRVLLSTEPVAGADDDDASASEAAGSVSFAASSQNARTTAAERLAALEQDALVGEVREHEVFCRPCGKWVRLSQSTKYLLHNWVKHAERVHGKRRSVLGRVLVRDGADN